MTALLEMKQHLKIFYSRYDIYLVPAIKFILAFFAFMMLNSQVGFMERIANPAIALLLALLCSFLPVNMMAVFGAMLLGAHAFALSLEVFALLAGLLFIMYAVYFRVAPGYGYVLVLTPLAFWLKIPYALPLVLGLVGGPAAAVPVGCGALIYYMIYFMKNNEKMLSSSESEQMATRLLYLVENMLNNKDMIMTILVLAVILMVVYAIRRMNVDYSWYLALGTGAVANIVLFLIGALIMETDVAILPLILGTLVSLMIAIAVEFFVFSVDYSRTEYTQFEDDEYYYYVKAIPKMSIAIPEKKVKKINSRSRQGRRRH
ncbi:MAG TPA: hypothetical protein DD414_11830 [Lachnospiraceae bacterium]|nr:hypothetical protein [Lachnospiraceae bacterium]